MRRRSCDYRKTAIFRGIKNGTLVVDDVTLATNVPGVFAGGDVVTGASTVVQAMAGGCAGRRGPIDRYLKGQDLYKDRIYTAAKRADVPRDEAAAEAAGEARGRAVMPQLGAADAGLQLYGGEHGLR